MAGFLLLWGAGHAAAQTPLTVDIASVDDAGAPVVRAVANVLDATQRPVRDLTASDFQVTVNGDSAAVRDVRAAVNSDIGMSVVIAVDVSGSMEGAPIEQARAAARAFVEGLAPADSAAILTFSDTVVTVQELTSDRAKLIAAIDGLRSTGDTALYQAATVASAQAAASTSQRPAIILLSDGVDFGGRSSVSRDESIARARQAGVPIFAVGMSAGIDREYLETLASATGGLFLETPTPDGLNDLFRSVGEFLRSQYVITVNAPKLDRSEPLTYDLRVRSGEATGRATLRLPPRVEAPPVPPPTVTLSGLVSGTEIEDPVVVQAEVQAGAELASVAFIVDGTPVYTFRSPPFVLNLDPRAYGDGAHSLRVEARDVEGRVGTAESGFTTIVPPPSEPSRVRPLPLIAALLLIAGAAVIFVLGRRRQRSPVQALESRVKPWSARGDAEGEDTVWKIPQPVKLEDRALGFLVVASGTKAGQSFPVGDRPRSIGASTACDIVLDNESGEFAAEEARVWVSKSRLVVHKLVRPGSIGAESIGEDWLFLDPGDQLDFGPTRFAFTLIEEGEAPPDAATAADRGLTQPQAGTASPS